MNHINKMTDLLFEELELAVKTSINLIQKIEDSQWNYRPKENMRSLVELVHHLVSIPLSDLTCLLEEKSEKEYRKIELDIEEIRDPEKLGTQMQHNFEKLKDYILALSDEDLMNKITKPFYFEQGGHIQIKWLIEIVTHTYHHRAQLFNYLKQLDHDINMFDLY
ncbi:DinB family protein [Metabacillus bambusae]|uniref:DinB family protein n=1 Tax=Metabacillus bambusae TaxID=2795218 RepID=A0ABS3N8B7_9BACI|nr:DinB family protein [Metabacillus bambusae]MBO1514537.1 DinB family protein [Metabacillus bambusae]